MDAQAHLLSLGWAGPGHPLHPSAYKQKGHRGLAYDPTANKTAFSQHTYPSNGLIKPLLVSQKQGKLGVGRRAHEPQAGNEWWLKGFEKALGDVGKSESERSSGVSTPVRMPADSGRFGPLYSFFVKGGEMEGTIGEEKNRNERRGKKRKSDVVDVGKDQKEDDFEQVAAFLATRDKDEKRRQRREKESAEEQFKAVEAFMEAREGKQRKRRKSEDGGLLADVSPEVSGKAKDMSKADQRKTTTVSSTESKEERRERRRRRKERRSLQRTTLPPTNGSHIMHDDHAMKALRKAEKKRRKEMKNTEGPSS